MSGHLWSCLAISGLVSLVGSGDKSAETPVTGTRDLVRIVQGPRRTPREKRPGPISLLLWDFNSSTDRAINSRLETGKVAGLVSSSELFRGSEDSAGRVTLVMRHPRAIGPSTLWAKVSAIDTMAVVGRWSMLDREGRRGGRISLRPGETARQKPI